MTTPAISIDSTHIDSVRPSLDSRSSSRRVSLEVPGNQFPPSPLSPRVPRSPGRNRSALRQFYGLAPTSPNGLGRAEDLAPVPEIDREGFDPEKHAEKLIADADLRELLKTENELVNEIRGFDGERKALVYDNYSKLISATDTIRKMRANMEPLTPTTSTLEPAIAHIAQVSASLVQTIPQSPIAPRNNTSQYDNSPKRTETVKWVLHSPERISELVKGGKKEEAENEWVIVLSVLDKWKNAKGIEELKERCEKALKGG
ncbi:hypothetical protein RUND412_006125 [Rhizina undulata]